MFTLLQVAALPSRPNPSDRGTSNPGAPPSESIASLAISDLRAVLRIAGGVNDRWDDPKVWRQYLLAETCELLDASIGVIQGQTIDADGRMGAQSTVLALHGWPDGQPTDPLTDALTAIENSSVRDLEPGIAPGIGTLFQRFEKRGFATVCRADIVDDGSYYQSVFHREFRSRVGSDDFVISVRHVIEPGRIEMITFDRPIGAQRFQRRDVTILRVLHDAIAPLIGLRLSTEEHICRDGLSTRLRDVLEALLEGSSEKAVSERLGLSSATIHEYVGMLYRHFKVQSRAELMAYFLSREPRSRP